MSKKEIGLMRKQLKDSGIPIVSLYKEKSDTVRDVSRTVPNSSQGAEILRPVFNQIDPYEEVLVLYLNRAGVMIGVYRMAQGGINGCVADVRLLMAAGVCLAASGFIVAHNHPSGMIRPSEEDISLTRRLKQAGEVMEIGMKDHLIITQTGYYSFADNGQL